MTVKIPDDSSRVVNSAPPWHESIALPTLLRRARATYGRSIRAALSASGFHDIPINGLYALGRLAPDGSGLPLTELIDGLGTSKQTAGQLVETLVTRGYVKRIPDEADRRRLHVALTPRGQAAAEVLLAERDRIDRAVTDAVGADNVRRTRRTLGAMAQLATHLTDGASQRSP